MFDGAVDFNQDLSGWDVGNCQHFVSARRIWLVCYDVDYNSQLLYSLLPGSLQKYMFKNSGMNHFIGDWEFKSIENCISNLSTFVSIG